MDNTIIFTAILIVINFTLVAIAVFGIGFFIGYKYEDKKIKQRKTKIEIMESKKTEKEKKSKKEWDNFLKYDGSVPQEKF